MLIYGDLYLIFGDLMVIEWDIHGDYPYTITTSHSKTTEII